MKHISYFIEISITVSTKIFYNYMKNNIPNFNKLSIK